MTTFSALYYIPPRFVHETLLIRTQSVETYAPVDLCDVKVLDSTTEGIGPSHGPKIDFVRLKVVGCGPSVNRDCPDSEIGEFLCANSPLVSEIVSVHRDVLPPANL